MRADVKVLLEMLTYARPAGSVTEGAFCNRFIATLPGAYRDRFDNWHVPIPHPNADAPRVLWSSHTDTVAFRDGRQTVHYSPATGIVRLSDRAIRQGRNCLGADCTAGVWIMAQMILRNVPGHYVFHSAEEKGGIGSSDLADHYDDWLRAFAVAIAFDRRGTNSIITKQMSSRTASDAFAASLAAELARVGLHGYSADPTGVFTDTANYAHLIPECTNVSVGTAGEHRIGETLNVNHCALVLDAMCAVDPSAFVITRDPVDEDPDDWRRVDPCFRGYLWDTDEDEDAELLEIYEREHRIDVPTDDDPTGVDSRFDSSPFLTREYADVHRALSTLELSKRRNADGRKWLLPRRSWQ